jgi:dihydroorotate dehydrogenase electron transfer subunit
MKQILDFTVRSVERVSDKHVLMRLTLPAPLPEMLPGQFVEVRIDGTPDTLLRRPISINFVDRRQNELWLLVAMVGSGTQWLGSRKAGDIVNCVLPLGNGFILPDGKTVQGNSSPVAASKMLLVGGGVGVAPLLYLGDCLQQAGHEVTFLLGGRSAKDVLELDLFKKYGRVCITTEDATLGERGFVTQHSVLAEPFDRIYTCGPTPMMKAVARYASEHAVWCEASLENLMACGLGACLCCVEKVKREETGAASQETTNVCVCKEGPVFNINRLLWQS